MRGTEGAFRFSHVASRWAKLKRKLLENEESHKKNNFIYTGYTLGKNSFIQNILQQTGFDRERFVFCTHHAEWDMAKHFRQKYFFDKAGLIEPAAVIINLSSNIILCLHGSL